MFIFSGCSSGQRKQIRHVCMESIGDKAPGSKCQCLFHSSKARGRHCQSHIPNSPGFSPVHSCACDQAVQPASCMCDNVGNTPRFRATYVLLTPHGCCCAKATTVTEPGMADPRSHPTWRETESSSLSAPQVSSTSPCHYLSLLLDHPSHSGVGPASVF